MSDNLGQATGGLNGDSLKLVNIREHEELVAAKRVMCLPSNQQTLMAYDGSSNLQYVGYAPKGLATSSTNWLLYNMSYASSALVSKKVAYDSWDNKSTVLYS